MHFPPYPVVSSPFWDVLTFYKNHVEELGVRLTIEQAVRKLPEEIRETAVLYFFQELKQREIAELLHIKLSLVKYRIGRAKELLMKELEVKKDEEL